MALPKRSSTVQKQNTAARDLKQRVISSMNKLSDRDTHAIACSDLESIAKTLTPDSFSSFLSCIYSTDSSHKSPVRRESVRLIGLLAASHGDILAPFLPRMVGSAIVQRLRDPDSAVRTACVEAVAQIASRITRPPFSSLLKPLSEALLLEQDINSQIGAALCLVAAIESAPAPDVEQLQRLLPRLLKLLRTPNFKAKAALLSLIGCVVTAGAARVGQMIGDLVSLLSEFLSSEDWGTRKAAADALASVAFTERDLLCDLKGSCLKSFEARRFDKVKAVRETMNKMLDAWRDVPDVAVNLTPPSQLKSSSIDSSDEGHFIACSRGSDSKSDSLCTKIASPFDKPTPVRKYKKPGSNLFCKMDRIAPSDWQMEEVAVTNAVPAEGIHKVDVPVRESTVGRFHEHREQKNIRNFYSNREVECSPSDNKRRDKTQKHGGLRSTSRVVPVEEKDSSESHVQPPIITSEVLNGSNQDSELSLVRKQLVQIEAQQSSLLNLLQVFMGNSQNSMRSLETRVQSLEAALDEISYDLAVSSGRMESSNTAGNACFKLPGTDFLGFKLRRRTDVRYAAPRFFSAGAGKATDCSHLDKRRFGVDGGLVLNPLADIHPEATVLSASASNSGPNHGMLSERSGQQSPFADRLAQASSPSVLSTERTSW